MSRKKRNRGSRAQRKATRNKSLKAPINPSPASLRASTVATHESAPPHPPSEVPIRRAPKAQALRAPLHAAFLCLCTLLSLLAGIFIKRERTEPLSLTRGEMQTSTSMAQHATQTEMSAGPPPALEEWLETTNADFRTGTLSAFRLRNVLGERLKETPLEHVREFLTSSSFATAPPIARALAVQRLSEAPYAFVRSLLEADSPPPLHPREVHALFRTQAAADLPGFVLWVNSLPPREQRTLAHEIATSLVAEPSRIASVIATLAPDTRQHVLHDAISLLKAYPERLLTFTAELPPHLAIPTALQGLTVAISDPIVGKGFSLSKHPQTVSMIHESIRSRESAAPYRELLSAEGVAESLPQGVARSLAFEFLYHRIAAIHPDSAVLRLSKLSDANDREYAALGIIQGCAHSQPLRALDLAASLPVDSPRRHDALLLAAYAARTLHSSISQHWLSAAKLSADERALLTGQSP